MALRVLVVDDVPSMRMVCRLYFERLDLDVEVLEAASGEEAIKILDAEPVDLVLSDHRMGVVTGLDVLKHALEHQPDALRCMMTGYGDPELATAANTEAKVHAFIQKSMGVAPMIDLLERKLVSRFVRSTGTEG